jgi:hypothetical protein
LKSRELNADGIKAVLLPRLRKAMEEESKPVTKVAEEKKGRGERKRTRSESDADADEDDETPDEDAYKKFPALVRPLLAALENCQGKSCRCPAHSADWSDHSLFLEPCIWSIIFLLERKELKHFMREDVLEGVLKMTAAKPSKTLRRCPLPI